MLAQAKMLNPPHKLWEGLQFYASILSKLESDRREKEEKKQNSGTKATIKGKNVISMKGKG